MCGNKLNYAFHLENNFHNLKLNEYYSLYCYFSPVIHKYITTKRSSFASTLESWHHLLQQSSSVKTSRFTRKFTWLTDLWKNKFFAIFWGGTYRFLTCCGQSVTADNADMVAGVQETKWCPKFRFKASSLIFCSLCQ